MNPDLFPYLLDWVGDVFLRIFGEFKRGLRGIDRMIRLDSAFTSAQRFVFLPGATGDDTFWKGVGALLPGFWEKHYLAWPGLGNQPAHPDIGCMGDLVGLASRVLTAPSVLVAQSMGGVIALQLALRFPGLITHLVLAATSGGPDVAALGAVDWRPAFLEDYPDTPLWFLDERTDLSALLSDVRVPTLLLWGEDDPVSPLSVGRHLAERIRDARLEIIPGGGHGFAKDMPQSVAPLILAHVFS